MGVHVHVCARVRPHAALGAHAAQDVATGAAGAYGGEATGIKSRVTKGRKLG